MRGTIEERFWDKVAMIPFHTCWEWTASRDAMGYGHFRVKQKMEKAHRISYTIHFGIIPSHLIVCHKCDNPGCVKPEHLWLGTKKDNAIDMMKKGRGTARFSDYDIIKIRKLYSEGMTQKAIAKLYDSQQSHISEITRRKQWKHL